MIWKRNLPACNFILGRIINISSVVGATGNTGQANYCAGTEGEIGFIKPVPQEYAGSNFTMNEEIEEEAILKNFSLGLCLASSENLYDPAPSGLIGP
uniref:Uncharacterized protein n=1 Tax=Physcomitrium patens TaxID=3218 RepID=A0A2K1IQK6_PHYPA|nr:hypothetical protein PHYPA_025685 [Physcomitrium patens]